MEPFHQIRFTRAQIPDWRRLLREEGFILTEYKQSWLGSRHPGYFDVVCERDTRRAVFAVASENAGSSETVFVYVNMQGDTLRREIRRRLESLGAEWSYYHG